MSRPSYRALFRQFAVLSCCCLAAVSCHQADVFSLGDASNQSLANALPQPKTRQHSGALLVDADNSLETFCSATIIAPGVVLTAAHCVKFPESTASMMRGKQFYYQMAHPSAADSFVVVPIVDFVVHPSYAISSEFLNISLPVDSDLELGDELAAQMEAKCDQSVLAPKSLQLFIDGNPTPEVLEAEIRLVQCAWQIMSDVFGKGEMLKKELIGAHDIAIGFLQQDIPNVQVAQLPSKILDIYDSAEPFTVAGYGLHAPMEEGCKTSGYLHETSTFVTAQSPLEMLLDNGGTTACFGDSGGGLLREHPEGWQIEGVIARTRLLPLSGRCWGGVAASKVAAYRPWIEATLAARGITLR